MILTFMMAYKYNNKIKFRQYKLLQMETLKELVASLGGDPYEILNTNPNAQLSQLRKNYRTLAFKYHPDKNKSEDAKEMFLKINQAFEYLEDEGNRFVYKNHIKALEERRKRQESLDADRRKMVDNLKRREEEYLQRQRDMEKELKRRKEFFEKKMREEEERENIRNEIYDNMGTQKYYEEVASVEVKWQQGLSFTAQMLKKAFSEYGGIKSINLQAKRNKARIVLSSIDNCTQLVNKFNHPLIDVQFYLQKSQRDHLLKALNTQKINKVDLSLNSQTILRFKEIMNRSSTLYRQ